MFLFLCAKEMRIQNNFAFVPFIRISGGGGEREVRDIAMKFAQNGDFFPLLPITICHCRVFNLLQKIMLSLYIVYNIREVLRWSLE